MKTFFILKDVSYFFSSSYICSQIKKISSVKEVYYNQFFDCFVVDTEDNEIIKDFFSQNNIKYQLNNYIKNHIPALIGLFIILLLSFLSNNLYLLSLSILFILYKVIRNYKFISDETILLIPLILLSIFNYHVYTYCVVLGYFSFNQLKNILINNIINDISNIDEHPTIKSNEKMDINTNEAKNTDIITVNKNHVLPVDGQIIDGFTQIDKSMYSSTIPIVNKDTGQNVYTSVNSLDNPENKAVLSETPELIKNHIFHFLASIKSEVNINQKYYLFTAVLFTVLLIICLSLNLNHPLLFFPITLIIIGLKEGLLSIQLINNIKLIKYLTDENILVNNYQNIENILNANTFIFEKNNILTVLNPDVKDVYINQKINPSDFYQIAYMLVKNKTKPYANCVKNYLKNIHLKSLDSNSIKGLIKKRKDFYANHKIIYYDKAKINDINLEKIQKNLDNFLHQGKKSLLFIEDNEIIGIINIQDMIHNSTIETINTLKSLNKRTILIDNNLPETLTYYQNKLHMDESYSYKSNHERLSLINSLKKSDTVYVTSEEIENDVTQILLHRNLNFTLKENTIIFNNPEITYLTDIINTKIKLDENTALNNKIADIFITLTALLVNPIISYTAIWLLPILKLLKIKKQH